MQQGDQQRREIGAADAAHAADDHDHERVGDGGEVHPEIRRSVRKREHAAESGQPGAEGEHRGEQHALINAERCHHLAVLRRGPHQPPPPRPREEQPEQGQHRRADRDQHQVVDREALAGDQGEAAQPAWPRQGQVVRSPDMQGCVLHDQDDAEGGEELEQLRRAIDAAQQPHLQQRAECGQRERGRHHAEREPRLRVRQAREDRPADIGAEHVEAAVGEVHDAGDAEDDRKPGRHEEQGGRAGQARQELDDDEAHRASQPAAAGRSLRTSASEGMTLAPST